MLDYQYKLQLIKIFNQFNTNKRNKNNLNTSFNKILLILLNNLNDKIKFYFKVLNVDVEADDEADGEVEDVDEDLIKIKFNDNDYKGSKLFYEINKCCYNSNYSDGVNSNSITFITSNYYFKSNEEIENLLLLLKIIIHSSLSMLIELNLLKTFSISTSPPHSPTVLTPPTSPPTSPTLSPKKKLTASSLVRNVLDKFNSGFFKPITSNLSDSTLIFSNQRPRLPKSLTNSSFSNKSLISNPLPNSFDSTDHSFKFARVVLKMQSQILSTSPSVSTFPAGSLLHRLARDEARNRYLNLFPYNHNSDPSIKIASDVKAGLASLLSHNCKKFYNFFSIKCY